MRGMVIACQRPDDGVLFVKSLGSPSGQVFSNSCKRQSKQLSLYEDNVFRITSENRDTAGIRSASTCARSWLAQITIEVSDEIDGWLPRASVSAKTLRYVMLFTAGFARVGPASDSERLVLPICGDSR
jgi:hypothetical protein